jgi:hypothetical protein
MFGVMSGEIMRTSSISLNPFSLMMEPEAVLQAMKRSESLRSLRRHKLRPLDRPLIPYVVRADAHAGPGEDDIETESGFLD